MHSSHIRCQRNDEHHEQAAINNPHTPGYVSMSHLCLSVVSLSRPVPLEPTPKVSGRCPESTATAPSPRFLPRLRLPSRLPPSAAGAGSAPRPSPAPPPQPSSKQQPQPCSGPTQGHVNLLGSRLRPRRGAGARARLRPRRLHGLSGRCVPPPPRSSRSAPARNVPAPAGGTLRRPRHPARVASALRQPPSVPARPLLPALPWRSARSDPPAVILGASPLGPGRFLCSVAGHRAPASVLALFSSRALLLWGLWQEEELRKGISE